ncbi:MAG TPA: DUF3854 domain-containing protein [Pyrinomonadaceae bacterium]|jgi:hypothetical protein
MTQPTTDTCLSKRHSEKLAVESAISDAVIKSRGYKTVTSKTELANLGFSREQQIVPCLLLPVYAPDGSTGLYQIRPDNPRQKRNSKNELTDGIVKYEIPKNAKMRIDCPPVCRPKLANPAIPIWITEGIPKGDALASNGVCAVALLGVWNFKGKNDFGGTALLADLDAIAWNGREVRIVFDSDVMTKPNVQKALERLKEVLQRRGAHVVAVYLPPGENGEKVGVDDFLRENSPEKLERLITAPRPIPQPAPATFELLDEAPAVMRRPLQIIDGRGYAATWLHVKKIVTESQNEKTGAIIRHNPPIETTAPELFVLRDDGKIFGNGAGAAMEEIGFDVHLPEVLPDKKVMSKKAVEGYRTNRRPAPVKIFLQIKNIINRFLDFNRSIADQQTMCELSALFILATWFTEGFNVAGYVWATGEKGSGKTQLLLLICEMAFLGEFIQASGSMASLRDLSDYGAFLGFDDAENVANKNFDPDKRNILLSGFTRGSQVTVKEPDAGGRGWKTHYVNTFTFRGFTATRTPDDVLASRSITLPLVRTSDKSKGDADPLDFTLWERSPKDLCGDLWQIGLEHLPKISTFERDAKNRASLTGRDLQQWTCLLTVALWLDSVDRAETLKRDNETLFERVNRLSVEYQSHRAELETGDVTRLVLRSIVQSIVPDLSEPYRIEEIEQQGKEWIRTTKEITEKAHSLIESEGLDFNVETTNTRKIGRVVGKLRIDKNRDAKARGWRITLTDLKSLLAAYSLLNTAKLNVIDVTNVTNVTESDKLTNDVSVVNDVNDVKKTSVIIPNQNGNGNGAKKFVVNEVI